MFSMKNIISKNNSTIWRKTVRNTVETVIRKLHAYACPKN